MKIPYAVVSEHIFVGANLILVCLTYPQLIRTNAVCDESRYFISFRFQWYALSIQLYTSHNYVLYGSNIMLCTWPVRTHGFMTSEHNWTLPEPAPKPTPKKRGILFLSHEDMQEAKKSMKEKGIKAEDVKNLPPI